jgi:lipoprotein signal peptidase
MIIFLSELTSCHISYLVFVFFENGAVDNVIDDFYPGDAIFLFLSRGTAES